MYIQPFFGKKSHYFCKFYIAFQYIITDIYLKIKSFISFFYYLRIVVHNVSLYYAPFVQFM